MQSDYSSFLFQEASGGTDHGVILAISELGATVPSIDFGNDHIQGPSIGLNTWAFIAATWNGPGSKRILYTNGIAVASDTPGGGTSVTNGTTAQIGTGAYPSGNLFDDVRVYSRALSAAEIQALYNAEK